MPTKTGVAANLAAITAGALVFGLAGVGVAGLVSGKRLMRCRCKAGEIARCVVANRADVGRRHRGEAQVQDEWSLR